MNGTTALIRLLFLILPTVIASTPKPMCTLVEFQWCLQSMQSQSNDLVNAATRYELLTACSSLQKSVSCVDNHMRYCFTATQRKVFNHVVAGARQVLPELCVAGPTQDAYLKHASCFKNVSEAKCGPKYRYLLQVSENVNHTKDVDEGLRKSCCAFGDFVTCKHLHINRDCGHDAALFLQHHLDKITNPLLQEHCAHYTYASDACTPTSRASDVTVGGAKCLICLANWLFLWSILGIYKT